MKKFDAVLLLFLMVIVAVLVRAEDTKEVVIASARELKGVKAKKTFNRLGDPIVKAVEVKGPNPVPFYMDATEVTVGQFKKFVEESGYSYMGRTGKDCQHRQNGNSYQVVNRTDEVGTIYRSKNRVIFLRSLFPEFNFVLIHLQREYCNDIRA